MMEFFFGGYLLALVIWPFFQGIRFMLPLLFLSVIYIFKGLQTISLRIKKPPVQLWMTVGLVLFALAGYASQYRWINFSPLTYGVEHPDALALFSHIQEHTSPGDVLVFFKPRAMALFTGRRTSGFKVYSADAQFWEWMDKIQADYLIAELFESEYNRVDGKLVYYADSFARRHPQRMALVYQNPSFHVYKIRPVNP